MSARVGALRIDLGLNTAEFQAGLARSTSQMQATQARFAAIGRSMAAAFAPVAAMLSAGVLVNAARQALVFADDLATAADQAGIAVERFQTLREGFRALEIDSTKVDTAFKRLHATMGAVQSGATDGATKALDRLGIRSRILNGEISTTDGLLDALAASAKTAGTEAQFADAMVDIFGRRVGVEMAAALRDGGEALHKLEEEFKRSGAVIDAQMIAKLADANEAIEAFQVQVHRHFVLATGHALEFGADFSRAIASLGPVFDRPVNNWASTLDRFFAQARQDIVMFLREIQGVANVALRVKDQLSFAFGIRGIFDKPSSPFTFADDVSRSFARSHISRLFNTNANGTRIGGGGGGSGVDLPEIAAGGGSGGRSRSGGRSGGSAGGAATPPPLTAADIRHRYMLEHMRELPRIATDAIQPLAKVQDTMADVGAIMANMTIPDFSRIMPVEDQQRLQAFAQTFHADLSNGLAEAIVGGRRLGDVLVETFKRAAVAALASGIFDLISGRGKENFVGQGIGSLFGGLKFLFGGTKFGGFRAAGGPVIPGRSYIVGEKGPEWFTPTTGGHIIPNGAGGSGGVTVIVNAQDAVLAKTCKAGSWRACRPRPKPARATRTGALSACPGLACRIGRN